MNQQAILYQAAYSAVLINVEKIIAGVEDAIADVVTAKQNMQIQLAVEEAVVNIINYAYPQQEASNAIIKMLIYKDDDYITIEIVDHGAAYNPLAANHPNLSDDLEERPVGGLGIYFIRQVADDVSYERDNGTNKLTLKINL